MKGKWKILALGNPLRGDDAVALRLADELSGHDIIKAETVPENFVSPGERIVLIDCLHFDGQPGEVRLFSKEEVEEFLSTSHNLTPLIVKVASEVRLIGIQPFSTAPGVRLSPGLEKELDRVKAEVKRLLERVLEE